jgi:ATP-dependent protease ClpP protease subunit
LQDEIRRLWDRRAHILQPPQAEARPWYRIQNAADDTTEIYIYDAIGGWFGITAADFVAELRQIATSRVLLHLNSPGGDAWDGIAIYTALKDSTAEITVKVDSLAASAASVIAMAGDKVVMAPHSTLMVHQAWGLVIGNSGDMVKEAEVLTKLDTAIAGVYADKAGGSIPDWLATMQEETWYTDQEAVAAGLADAVGSAAAASASVPHKAFDLNMFKHPPAAPPLPSLPVSSNFTNHLPDLQSMLASVRDD